MHNIAFLAVGSQAEPQGFSTLLQLQKNAERTSFYVPDQLPEGTGRNAAEGKRKGIMYEKAVRFIDDVLCLAASSLSGCDTWRTGMRCDSA